MTASPGAPPRSPAASLPRILHCHSTFAPGGKEVRCARLMNAWGGAMEHTIVSAQPQLGARALIDPAINAAFPQDFPALTGAPTPWRLAGIAAALKPYDLICTYNWGAMDAVMAHRVFATVMALPPLVHHEDGFNEDEAHGLKPSRNLYRRAALARATRLIVPSSGLERIALETWHQPRSRVERIANGIDTAAFAQRPAVAPDPAALPLAKPAGHHWVGTLAGLRAVKNLPLLVAAAGGLPEDWHLVIVGDGPERANILAAADARGISHRVHLPGAVADPASIIGLFDIFALSSASEQFPLSVVEAMAAALPVAAPDVGDIRAMVAPTNQPFIIALADASDKTAALGDALTRLAADADLRARIGADNQARARAEYDFAAMLAQYSAVYGAAMGRDI